MANRHMKRCSISLMMGKYNTKPRLLAWQLSGKIRNSAGEDVEKREPSYTGGGNAHCTDTVENRMEFPLLKKHNYHMIQKFHFWLMYLKNIKTPTQKDSYTCILMFIAALFQ